MSTPDQIGCSVYPVNSAFVSRAEALTDGGLSVSAYLNANPTHLYATQLALLRHNLRYCDTTRVTAIQLI